MQIVLGATLSIDTRTFRQGPTAALGPRRQLLAYTPSPLWSMRCGVVGYQPAYEAESDLFHNVASANKAELIQMKRGGHAWEGADLDRVCVRG